MGAHFQQLLEVLAGNDRGGGDRLVDYRNVAFFDMARRFDKSSRPLASKVLNTPERARRNGNGSWNHELHEARFAFIRVFRGFVPHRLLKAWAKFPLLLQHRGLRAQGNQMPARPRMHRLVEQPDEGSL